MAKSVKLKDNVYWDSSSVACNRSKLSNIINITRTSLNTAGWYRVAILDNSGKTPNGAWGGVFLIDLHTFYNNDNNMSCFLCVNMAYKNYKITNLSSAINAKSFDKIRVVKDTTSGYICLEFHYTSNKSNDIRYNIIQWTDTFEIVDWKKVADDTGTVLATLDL